MQRLAGISASDVSAIVGVNPYRSRIDVWLEKTGQAAPALDNERTKWGQLLEPVIRDDYAERHGVQVRTFGTLEKSGWMFATPDGIVSDIGSSPSVDGWRHGLEVKTHSWRVAHLYGMPHTDEIPLWELCQCMWGMAVTDLPRWDLVAFIDGAPTDYTVMRDDETIGNLVDECERFLRDHITARAQPEPDGSDSFTTFLRDRWKSTQANLIDIGDDVDTFSLIEQSRELRAEVASREAILETTIQRLKTLIGPNEGLAWKDAKGRPQKVTWKHSKPVVDTDHAAMAQALVGRAALCSSGTRATFERAMICLQSHGATNYIGHSTLATITAGEVSELLAQLTTTIKSIATEPVKTYQTERAPARPFNFPRSWSKTNGK